LNPCVAHCSTDSIPWVHHSREEGSLDYDGGFVHLQIHMNFDTIIYHQQPVRPVTPVRPLDRADQAGGYSSCTTNVPESLSDFSRPWNKNTPKTQPTRKENPTQNLTKQLQTDQELTSSAKTQRHTSQEVHPRKIPQVTHTGQTGQEHRSDRCSLSSSG
jgi:hypothetical protein